MALSNELFIGLRTELKSKSKERQHTLGLVTARIHYIPVLGSTSGWEPLVEESSHGQPNPIQFLREREMEK